MKLKIQKNVPVPPVTQRVGHNKALLMQMKPGDSVYFDAPIASHALRFYRVAKKMGIKIVIRKDAGGMRMWRVAEEDTDHPPHVREAARTAIDKASRKVHA